ncbi:MAG: adenylate/guanylate cyclase domain-containing protein, partial [Anaerolineae bacterium]|nr:adenylate/guanylate cyclase domain-containing protein [Anaerolineae bacterium]
APPWTAIVLIVVMAQLAWWINKINRLERPTIAVVILGTVMAAYFIIRHLIFVRSGWQFVIVTPELTLFLGVILPTLEQAAAQEIEKRRVRSLFSRFISPEMVSQIIDTKDINSLNKRTELTILFSDIRGFTTLSEKLRPDELVALLNPYLEAMTRIIHKYGGTVDKYEGDAILAFFGEPIAYGDHASRAVKAALEMRIVLAELTQKWKDEKHFSEVFEMGVGINSGEVFVGLLGSEQRVNYTVIGDNVNLAARLQDQTKEFNWPILLSGATYEKIKDEFDFEYIESRTVKGKTEEVKIYKLLGRVGALERDRVKPYEIIGDELYEQPKEAENKEDENDEEQRPYLMY